MKKTFAARRVPRKIGRDNDDQDDDETPTAAAIEVGPQAERVVKRPISSKPKKRSSLRLSFGPGDADVASGHAEGSPAVFTPKKSRLALDNNAERKSLRKPLPSEQLPFRAGVSEDKPSYSKDYLAELRNSTPSTPKGSKSAAASEDDEPSKALDIASKFGPLASFKSDDSSLIPTEAEIREKKERRARLAKQQQNFIPLDGEEDEGFASDGSESRNEIILPPKEKYPESRLVREDEDIAEGFDDFVEDGKISLGRKAERDAKKKRRTEIAELIAEAENASSDDASDDSEADRNAAYEAAQTRAGAYGNRDWNAAEAQGIRTPPRIAPLPELSAVVDRLNASLKSMGDARAKKVKRMEELRAEKAEIAEREAWIQTQLKETGERYEKLRIEAGLGAGTVTPLNGNDGAKIMVSRGLG